MSWIYLILAGAFEIGWPIGFKLASNGSKIWIVFSIVSMGLSGLFLYLAQKNIPISTAYIVWSGIGGLGTALIGIMIFNDSISFLKLMFLSLILIGLVGIKIVS
ncbi:DMT family transporter [Campylobacter sp. RM12647]|uniref:DMT family transporter n=1 Tax=Campylobacter sp. RM12647 TaxID=2735737 RepID=UPI001D64DFF1|nr:multidrug efflux SMR transporter [Campylobacter sp. RM12647]